MDGFSCGWDLHRRNGFLCRFGSSFVINPGDFHFLAGFPTGKLEREIGIFRNTGAKLCMKYGLAIAACGHFGNEMGRDDRTILLFAATRFHRMRYEHLDRNNVILNYCFYFHDFTPEMVLMVID
jgi:hypothetical protein